MAGYSMNLRNARSQDIVNQIGAAGTLNIMGGTRPPTGGAAGAPLGTLALENPAGTVLNAVLTFTKPNDTPAVGNGTATWARISDGSGNQVADLSLTDTTGNGEVKLNTTTISTGLWMSVQAMQVTEGNP